MSTEAQVAKTGVDDQDAEIARLRAALSEKEEKDAKNAEIARLKSALSEKEPTPVRAEAVAAEPVKGVVSDQPQSSNVNNINISLAKDEDKGVAHCCHCMLFLVTVGFWTPCWIGACCDCCCQRPCNAKC